MKYTVHVHTEKGHESFEVESTAPMELYEKVYKALGERYDGKIIRMPYVIKNESAPCAAVAAGPVDCDCNCERCPTVMIESVPRTFNAGPEIAPGEVLL